MMPTRWPLHLTLMLVLAAAIGASETSSGAGAVWLQGMLERDSWVAVRFNLTPDHDVAAHGRIYYSHLDAPRIGAATYIIADGQPVSQSFGPAGLSPFPPAEKEIAYVGAADQRVGVFGGGSGGGRDNLPFGYNGWYPVAAHSAIALAIVRAPSTYWTLNVSWTQGVTSYDVLTGPAIVLYKDEFPSGVHAGTYGFQGSAGASALAAYSLSTAADTVGWFMPSTSTLSSGWATLDGEPYEGTPHGFGSMLVVSEGPSEWTFGVDYALEADNPALALGLAQLPPGSLSP